MRPVRRASGALSFIVGAVTGVASVRMFGGRRFWRAAEDPFGPDTARGASQKPVDAGSLKSGFEEQDANARELGWTMAIFAMCTVGAVALMLLLVRLWHSQDAAREAGLTSLQRHQSEPPLPHLQANPTSELGALKAREMTKLSGYAKLDENTARIPIDRAMALIIGQSLDAHASPEHKP